MCFEPAEFTINSLAQRAQKARILVFFFGFAKNKHP
jgi:hypothetical protein